MSYRFSRTQGSVSGDAALQSSAPVYGLFVFVARAQAQHPPFHLVCTAMEPNNHKVRSKLRRTEDPSPRVRRASRNAVPTDEYWAHAKSKVQERFSWSFVGVLATLSSRVRRKSNVHRVQVWNVNRRLLKNDVPLFLEKLKIVHASGRIKDGVQWQDLEAAANAVLARGAVQRTAAAAVHLPASDAEHGDDHEETDEVSSTDADSADED